jgi:hypothetical protein
VTYLAAALFFTLVLLASLVALHLTVRRDWAQILLALKGELGSPVRTAPSTFAGRRRAAF